MSVSQIFDYLMELEKNGFTGSVTLNFHKGDLSGKVKKKVSERIEE